MFEKAVAVVLQRVLGHFLKGFDSESLKLSVWDGNIALFNLELNTEAIETLGLPVSVLGGTVGEVRVQVPWSHLSTKPITITIKKLLLLVAPKDIDKWDPQAEKQRLLKAKREQLELWETMEREKGALQGMGERMVNQLVQVESPNTCLSVNLLQLLRTTLDYGRLCCARSSSTSQTSMCGSRVAVTRRRSSLV